MENKECTAKVTTGKACARCGKFFSHNHLRERLCPACRPVYAASGAQAGRPRRVCHDCGKHTSNYRCAACWTLIRIKHDIPYDVADW